MSGIRSEIKRTQERNKNIFPKYELGGGSLCLDLTNFGFTTLVFYIFSRLIYIGSKIEPYGEVPIKKAYNSLATIYQRI